MKKIIRLPSMWRRIGAHGIDLACILVLFSLLYFLLVLPLSFDATTFEEAGRIMVDAELESGLFVRLSDTLVGSPIEYAKVNSLPSMSSTSFTVNGKTTTVYLLDSLYDYYTEKRISFHEDKPLLTKETFESDVLHIGKGDSNIASFYFDEESSHYRITLTDSAKLSTAISYFTSVFREANTEVDECPLIKEQTKIRDGMALFALAMTLPTIGGVAFLFTGIIPLFLPNGKTIGKIPTHLVVLTGDGYEIRKWQLIPRSISYIILELIGGVLSFGALFLISYTMTMFNKKHRPFHDFIAFTVVADEKDSFWFKDRVEEADYLEEHKDDEASEVLPL